MWPTPGMVYGFKAFGILCYGVSRVLQVAVALEANVKLPSCSYRLEGRWV